VATLADVAGGFGRALREGGIGVPLSAVASFAQALGELGVDSASAVFWAGHCSFVRRPEDRAAYARIFAEYFSGSDTPVWVDTEEELLLALGGTEDDAEPQSETSEEDASVRAMRYSATEVLAHKDFALCNEEELREIERLMAALVHRPARRRSRRRVPTNRPHGTPDLRRTVRAAVRHGGETPRLYRLGPSFRERPVVLLIDVSGSMDSYSRAFVEFAHASVAARRRIEVFALGTRLTRITRALAWHDPDRALAWAFDSVADMSGGTRLGEAIGEFNDRYGVAGMARGALVVIFSDGWDRGDPERIGQEMDRLDRVAHRIVWVNPLKFAPGYAPLARGMAAALPHVDDFLEGHSLASLEELVGVMER
jgi:uncharacterized protein with von Willebrand factor type A (vWA) domain